METDEKLLLMIKELSVSLYTDLSTQEQQLLGKDLVQVLSKDANETLSNFSDLFKSLKNFESLVKNSANNKKFKENEVYQKELQKLDSEIRQHFKNELEMKVLIDGLDEKMKDFHSENLILLEQNYKTIESLIQTNKKLKESLRQRTQEIEELKKIGNSEQEKENFEGKVKKESEAIQEITLNNEKNFKKYSKMKSELETTNKEYEKLRSEFIELKSRSDYKLDLTAFNKDFKDYTQESFEIKSSRMARTPDRIEKSLSPISKSKKKQKTRINKTSSRFEKSPFFQPLSEAKKKLKKYQRPLKTKKEKN
jgi:hypothetical protein